MNHYHLKSGQIVDFKTAQMLQGLLNDVSEFEFYIVMHDTEHNEVEQELS